MPTESTPMRWPAAWKDPATLALLKNSPVDCLLVDSKAGLEPLITEAERNHLSVAEIRSPPPGVVVVEGQWPGVHVSRTAGRDGASAGPTGQPWVDSNGWKIRLWKAMHPERRIWVDALPEAPRLYPESYIMAVADAAAFGARWMLSLHNGLAADLAAQKPEALVAWEKILAAVRFFAAHENWSSYSAEAVLGVVSDFAGPNEFLNTEVLNLLTRASQQFRIIRKDNVAALSFNGLRTVLYLDGDPPAPELRAKVLEFVRAGGMLVTGPKWGSLPGASAKEGEHPRFSIRALGRGRIAAAHEQTDDPYLIANDSIILTSHRHELVRFWNGGAVLAYYTMTLNRKRALVHMLFYANRGPYAPSVRIAGRFRSALLWTFGQSTARPVEMGQGNESVELHLPAASQYLAAELEA